MRIAVCMVSLTGALLLALGGGCYEVPVTGRSAISLVSDPQVIKQSRAAFEQLKKTQRISTNREFNERVRRVGERLSKVVFWDVPDADWEFVVFDAPKTINAFAMPGGKVGVYSGLFQILANDDQLASVLAHEIAHVAARHTNERLSQNMAIQGGGLLVGGVMAGSGAASVTSNAVLDAYGLSAGVTVVGFDRKKEKEADHIGLMYMARAGYDPEESIKVLEALEEASAGQASPPAWLSTHPSNPERIQQLTELMPKALQVYGQSGLKQTPVIVK